MIIRTTEQYVEMAELMFADVKMWDEHELILIEKVFIGQDADRVAGAMIVMVGLGYYEHPPLSLMMKEIGVIPG